MSYLKNMNGVAICEDFFYLEASLWWQNDEKVATQNVSEKFQKFTIDQLQIDKRITSPMKN